MSAAIANSHWISSIWAPPSNPPRLLRPRGMHSPMLRPSSTRCCRNSRPWRRMAPGEPAPGQAAVDRSGAAQGDHGDLVRLLLRHAMARHWPAVRHSVRHALHPVRPLDEARLVAPAAQPLDPGLAAGLRRHPRSQRRHRRQPLLSVGAELLRPRLRWRQEDQGHQDPPRRGQVRIPLAITVSTANVHDSKGIVPVLHQLAGFKGTALGDLSYRGQRLSKRHSASPSNPAPAAEPSFQRGFGGSLSALWDG
jgi:hypothetical protein